MIWVTSNVLAIPPKLYIFFQYGKLKAMKTERIDKILAHHGFGTRKEVKKLLHAKRVLVNGEVCVSQDKHIHTETDTITVDDEILVLRHHVYLMLHKCVDVVCSTKDGLHKTVLDILPEEYQIPFMGGDLHPIGRLDIDTEGLLLLTTDGALTHILTSPKNHIPKTYFVRLENPVTQENQQEWKALFAQGIHVGPEGKEAEFDAQSAELDWVSEREATLTIYEGKYHQVKRMFKEMGNHVIYLKRTKIASLSLDENLKLGECRELTEEEKEKLFEI